MIQRVQEMEDALNSAEKRAANVERTRDQMNAEVDELVMDLSQAQHQAKQLEEKHKKVDQQVHHWRDKHSEIR